LKKFLKNKKFWMEKKQKFNKEENKGKKKLKKPNL